MSGPSQSNAPQSRAPIVAESAATIDGALPSTDRSAVQREQVASPEKILDSSSSLSPKQVRPAEQSNQVSGEIERSQVVVEAPALPQSRINVTGIRSGEVSIADARVDTPGREEFARYSKVVEELQLTSARLAELNRRGVDESTDEFRDQLKKLEKLSQQITEISGQSIEELLELSPKRGLNRDIRAIIHGSPLICEALRIYERWRAREKPTDEEARQREQEKNRESEKEREKEKEKERNRTTRGQIAAMRRGNYLSSTQQVEAPAQVQISYAAEEERFQAKEAARRQQDDDLRVRQGEAQRLADIAERMYDIDPNQLTPEARARIEVRRGLDAVDAHESHSTRFGVAQPRIRYYGQYFTQETVEDKKEVA